MHRWLHPRVRAAVREGREQGGLSGVKLIRESEQSSREQEQEQRMSNATTQLSARYASFSTFDKFYIVKEEDWIT